MTSMHKHLCCLVLAACTATASTAAAGELQLSIANGRATLIATDAPIRQVLAEWARVGETKVVNGEKLVGPNLTIKLIDRPEREVLDAVLRTAAGYVAAPRSSVAANLSVYDRILILPTSTAPPHNPGSMPTPTYTVPQRTPPPMPMPVDDDPVEQPVVVPPGGVMPPGATAVQPGPAAVQPGAMQPGQQPAPGMPQTLPRPGMLPQPAPTTPNPYAPAPYVPINPNQPGARPPGTPGGAPVPGGVRPPGGGGQ